MAPINKSAMRQVGKAIQSLDAFSHVNNDELGAPENARRIDNARKNLINALFANGYELQEYTCRVIKSKYQRKLIM